MKNNKLNKKKNWHKPQICIITKEELESHIKAAAMSGLTCIPDLSR